MKPTDEQINARIAAFMGYIKSDEYLAVDHYYIPGLCESICSINNLPFTTSLDALIPVVEKLGVISFEFNSDWVESGRKWIGTIEIPDPDDLNNVLVVNMSSKSPARALAMAIYEVLENGE